MLLVGFNYVCLITIYPKTLNSDLHVSNQYVFSQRVNKFQKLSCYVGGGNVVVAMMLGTEALRDCSELDQNLANRCNTGKAE